MLILKRSKKGKNKTEINKEIDNGGGRKEE